jgi:hypothetical protein
MRRVPRSLLMLSCAVLMIAGTWFLGWWAVPVVAALYAVGRREMSAPREAGLAAMLAWLVLLIRLKAQPSFATLLAELGQIFPVPGIAVAGLALLLAMVLAVTAARLVIGIVGIRTAQ